MFQEHLFLESLYRNIDVDNVEECLLCLKHIKLTCSKSPTETVIFFVHSLSSPLNGGKFSAKNNTHVH